jgi:hypothetical protein
MLANYQSAFTQLAKKTWEEGHSNGTEKLNKEAQRTLNQCFTAQKMVAGNMVLVEKLLNTDFLGDEFGRLRNSLDTDGQLPLPTTTTLPPPPMSRLLDLLDWTRGFNGKECCNVKASPGVCCQVTPQQRPGLLPVRYQQGRGGECFELITNNYSAATTYAPSAYHGLGT